jgi:hypothetical protein
MEKIRANLILEILGRPSGHVKEALAGLVAKLGSEKGVKILDKQLHDIIPVEGSDSLFTTFAEVQLEFDAIENYLATLFGYMPSNVEIIQPERFTLTNAQLNELGGMLIQRLHNYEAIAKRVLTEREFILGELKKSAPEVFNKLVKPAGQKPVENLPKKPIENKSPPKKSAKKKKAK